MNTSRQLHRQRNWAKQNRRTQNARLNKPFNGPSPFGQHYYDRKGRPIKKLLRWARLSSNRRYKRVLSTRISHYWVSTVWLGLDHNVVFWENDPPLIFETMAFDVDKRTENEAFGFKFSYLEEVTQVRYSTEKQARKGHWALVCAWRQRASARGVARVTTNKTTD